MGYVILDFASLVAFAALFFFVGLTNPPNPSLREMLYGSQPNLVAHPWLFCGPGVALAFMLVGLWLLKPEMIKERKSYAIRCR